MAITQKKRLGQQFTPASIAKLVGALSVGLSTRRVLDPTCGDGELLGEVSHFVKGAGREIVGVEIDRRLARMASRRLEASSRSGLRGRVVCADVFEAAAGVGRLRKAGLTGFDSVVGNPPYVRYQTVAHHSERATGVGSPLAVSADARIRSCLLASSLGAPVATVHELQEATRTWRGKRDAVDIADELERDWIRLVTNYSGLSDLALPTWLLTRLLCKPKGVVALVTTESIYNRVYGRFLRYFLLRFMEPVLVLQQEGPGWFANAQVRACVVVARRRSDEEARTSLRERMARPGRVVPRIVLNRHANPATTEGFSHVCRRLGIDAGVTVREQAEAIAVALLSGKTVPSLWTVRRDDEHVLAARLVSELGGYAGEMLDRLEGPARRPAPHMPRAAHGQLSRLCADLLGRQRSLRLDEFPLNHVADVHQGLRTGCNRFFYVDVTGDCDSAGCAGSDSSRPVMVNLDSVGHVRVPRRYFRPVVKTRAEARDWRDHRRTPSTHVFIANGGARDSDLKALAGLPAAQLRLWRREGLHALPRILADYISTAESWEFETASGLGRIFELSAVAPNARQPRRGCRPIDDAARPIPSWWYSLSLKPRHVAGLFVPRVNSGSVEAFANKTDEPLVIDANFSTVVPQSHWTSDQLLAYLNTSLAAAWFEEYATPMGGGALKVEAEHMRALPLPLLSDTALHELDRLGRLMRSPPAGILDRLKRDATAVVLAEVLPAADVRKACSRLEDRLLEMCRSRSPRPQVSSSARFKESASSIRAFSDPAQSVEVA